MSVDGFSMASIGMPKDITSAQAALSTEHGINIGNEKVVGKIDRALNKKINNEEKEEKNRRNQDFKDGYDENEEDEEKKDIVDKDEKITGKKAKELKITAIKDPQNVVLYFNNKTEKVELYNKVTKKILESINVNDFVEMINKLDYNSGILVNKTI